MAILAKGNDGESNFKPVPEGTHLARCITVVDCGMQKIEWKGEEKWQHKVWIAFEIPAVRVQWTDKEDVEHDKPAIIGKMYTNSISEKAHLGIHLAAWRGKAFTNKEIADGFDVSVLLDKPCQVSVAHNTANNGKTYANINAIMGLPAGVEAPAREGDLMLYDPGAAEAPQVFEKLPEWLQEKVTFGHRLDTSQPNTAQSFGESKPVEKYSEEGKNDFDDDIPF